MKLENNFKACINTPAGNLELVANELGLKRINFMKTKKLPRKDGRKKSQILRDTIKQLNEYFKGKRKEFDLPIFINSSNFNLNVWIELATVPFGWTISYGVLAKRIKKPKAARAVGNSVGKNPIPIIIPCHRVIHNDGTLGGFSGGIKIKEILLKHEEII